jgi:MFS family permease
MPESRQTACVAGKKCHVVFALSLSLKAMHKEQAIASGVRLPNYAAIVSLLVATLFTQIGNGILGSLAPLSGQRHGFENYQIGLLASGYFAGMLVGAVLSSWLIRRGGHVRALAGCIALCAISTLALALYVEPYAWVGFRFVTGFGFAGIYSSVESWLQGRTSDSERGRIFGIYSVVQYAGSTIGTQLLKLDEPTAFTLFSIAAMMLTIATIPMALTTQTPPEPPTNPSLRVLEFFRESPVGAVGALLVGLSVGPHWTLTPVFAAGNGLTIGEVATLMTSLTLGSALAQIPVGRLSDRFDRRKVLIGLCLAAAALNLAMSVAFPHLPRLAQDIAFFFLGAFVATQYYVTAAHANDRAAPDQSVRIAALLLFLYCVGAIVGPNTAAFAMDRFGLGALYIHNAAVELVLAAFAAHRIMRRSPPLKQPMDPDPKVYKPAA